MFLARHPTFLFCLGEYYYYQWLVFHKTTACFSQNDGLFFAKRRVVFHKVTCRFLYANGKRKKQDENGSE